VNLTVELEILLFLHGAMSEVSTDITICTWRDVRSLYKYSINICT